MNAGVQVGIVGPFAKAIRVHDHMQAKAPLEGT
jgi:hypothetical protein